MGYELIAIFWLLSIFYACCGLYCYATRPVKPRPIEFDNLEAAPGIDDLAWLDKALEEDDLTTPKTCFSDDWFDEQGIAEAKAEVLSESRLYNKMVVVGSRNVKGKWYPRRRRLIDMLLSPAGDLLEAITPKAFERLNGHGPRQANIIQKRWLGRNYNSGKVDIHTACDQFYSELGYQSAQEMLDEVEQLKQMQRSVL